MRRRRWLGLLAVAGALAGTLLLGGSAQAATLVVDQNDIGCNDLTGTPYCTIQAAIDDALQGDTIDVRNGDYDENIVVDVSSLTIMGEDRQDTAIDGDDAGDTVQVTANGVTITNLTIRNGNDYNLYVTGNRLTLDAVTVQGADGDNIYVSANRFKMTNSASRTADGYCVYVEGDRTAITNSRIKGCVYDGIYIDGESPRVATSRIQQVGEDAVDLYDPDQSDNQNGIVRDNLIRAAYSTGIYIEYGGGARIFRNDIYTSDYGIYVYDADAAFVDSNNVHTSYDEAIYVDDYSYGGHTITNNTADAYYDCIEFYGDDSVVSGNTLGPCQAGYGIYTDSSDDVTVNDNEIHETYYELIYTSGSGLHTVNNNTISDVYYNGIYVSATDAEVNGNDVRNVSDDYGLYISATGAEVTNNTVINTYYDGIYVSDSGTPTVSDNTVMYTCEALT